MTRRAALAVAIIAIVGMSALAGCGGAPEPSPKERAQIEFRQYMANTREALKSYRTAFRLTDKAWVRIDQMTYALEGSAEVARLYRVASTRHEEAAIRQRLAQPPKKLASVNTAVARHLDKVGGYADDLSAAFAARSISRVEALMRQGGPDWDVRTRWRNEVAAYARSVDVPMPPWFSPVGRTRTPRL